MSEKNKKCGDEVWDELIELKYHETMAVGREMEIEYGTTVVRVPNGWVYITAVHGVGVTSCFVPK